MNFFNTISNIWSFICTNWLGGLIGIIIRVVLLLIIGFSTKRLPHWSIFVILAVCLTLSGMFVNSWFKKENFTIKIPTNTELADKLDKNIDNKWSNTNGGFTFKQIEDAKVDSECPVIDDVILNINVQDYGDYVCFFGPDCKNSSSV